MDYKISVVKKDNNSNIWKTEEFSWNFVKDMQMKYFQYSYEMIKNLANSLLTPLEKAVFLTLMYNRFGNTTACLLSKSSTARVMNISYNTASKGLEGLVKAKVICKVNGYIFDNRICQFYINDYDKWEIPNKQIDKPLIQGLM
jgi:hypothetical protein